VIPAIFFASGPFKLKETTSVEVGGRQGSSYELAVTGV